MNEYTEMDDRTLVEMTLVGKSEAFEELVVRHEKAVRKSAYNVTGNAYSAEDASQDAFVAAWMRLDTLDDFARFSPWVCRIAANRAKDLMAKYRRDIPDLSLDLDVLENVVSDDADIVELISLRSGEVQDEKLAAALDALSAKIREVITLHYFDELSVDEIAARLSLPAGTVKWRLSEGRRKLRKEYGRMEKEYNENDTLVSRVMYAVEQLKMWRLQANKTGFEDEYREVLALVSELEESEQKSHAAADVLLMGYWWIDEEQNDELMERIRAEAEKGHNEEVMSAVAEYLFDKNKYDVNYAKKELIPYLEKHGFVKALGNHKSALAEFLHGKDEKLDMLRDALTLLTEKDECYYIDRKLIEYLEKSEDGEDSMSAVSIQKIRTIDGVRYYWSRSHGVMTSGGSIFDFKHIVPYMELWLYDDNRRIWGEIAHKAGDKLEINPYGAPIQDKYVAETDAVVTVPAGTFENCDHVVGEYRFHGGSSFRDEMWFCHGVGPVKYQHRGSSKEYESTWELASYDVCGEGRCPLGKGSRREFICTYHDPDLDELEYTNTSEVVYEDGDTAFIMFYYKYKFINESKRTWRSEFLKFEKNSWDVIDGKWSPTPVDDKSLEQLKELAANNRERVYTEINGKHRRHIYETAHESNYPGKTKLAYWDPFEPRFLERKDGEIHFVRGEDLWRGDWYMHQPTPDQRTGYIMVHNSLYQEIDTLIGAIWSDKWTPGYKGEHHTSHWGEEADNTFEVKNGGAVETPAGTFENCILVELKSENNGNLRYLHGKKEYYYAPGIGIVKFVTYYGGENDERFEKIKFMLTKYDGVGEGYFPIENGLFRRMEPLPMPEGCDISVETTITVDDDAAVIFIDQCATKEIDPGEGSKGE